MNKLLIKTKIAKDSFMSESKRVLKNTKGDQITGWLIVILIVVVVGASGSLNEMPELFA